MNSILNKLGDSLLSTKLDFIYGFLKNMNDAGTNQVIQLIKNKVGLDISNSDVLENLSEEQVNEIRTCVFDNFSTISDIHLQYKKLDVGNTKDARNMYLKTMDMNKNDKILAYFTPAYASAVTLTGLAYIFCITFFTIPEPNRGYANTILGFVMGTLVSPIVGFYFGSSSRTPTGVDGGGIKNNTTSRVGTKDTTLTAKCEVTENEDPLLPRE